MVSSVTVVGSNAMPITLSFDSTANISIAEQIARRISASISAGKLVTESDTNGPPPTLPQGVSGAYVQTTAAQVTLPKGYTTDLVTKPGSAVVFGSGAEDESILSDIPTSLTFIAAGGSGTVVAGGGNDRILIPDSTKGNWGLYTGDGDDVIRALGAGNDTIGAGGGHNSIQLGAGNDMITSVGDDTIVGSTGSETVNAAGASSTFVQGDQSKLYFVGGLGGATILGGSGSDTYFGASGGTTGAQQIKGGTAGNNELFAGSGPATLTGGGDNDHLVAHGADNQVRVAGAGNETLSAAFSSGNDLLVAGSGKNVLVGGTGSDTFVAGTGQSTIMAGSGNQIFAFVNHQAGGSELVTDVTNPSSLYIALQGYGSDEAANALAHQTEKNGSVSISLSDGTKVTFDNVAALHPSNFV